MKALHITAHGPATALAPVDIPVPALAKGQVRIQIEAAGVNPSDVVSIEGRFPHAVLPRILGRDFAGRPAYETFLRQLFAQRNQGLCLATTRYRIKDLEGYAATAPQCDRCRQGSTPADLPGLYRRGRRRCIPLLRYDSTC